MGLDMYLKGSRYISSWKEGEKELGEKIAQIVGQEGMAVNIVEMEVGYWRKANAVHQWFVKNVQDDVDDCKSYWVPRKKLLELQDVCNQVLADVTLASSLLPTQGGFFFGNLEYDEWYMENLEITLQNIQKALSLPEEWDIEYQSSW
jgi:hypothetical protein